MTIQRFLGSVEELGEREIGVVAATAQLARDGHVLEPSGINLTNYRKNPVVLWSHNPEQPVAACTAIAVENGALGARIEFAPTGASATADEICALVKSGIVRGVSIGFDPVEAEPLDPSRGSRGGLHITQSELLEISLCAVPVDTGAAVVARSFAARPGAAAMLRALPSISRRAIDRAMENVGRSREMPRPYAFLSPREKFEIDRQRTMTAWAIGQARDAERRERDARYSLEQRQADLRQLSRERTH